MSSRTIVEEITTVPATPSPFHTQPDVEKEIKNDTTSFFKNAEMRIDSFAAPSTISATTIWMIGISLFLLAKIWPPLVLIATYAVAVFVPHNFRVNDDAVVRRQMMNQFEKEDEIAKHLRTIPSNVRLESGYWANERGILLHTNTLIPANQPVKAVICYCHGFLDDVTFTKRQPLLHFVQQGIAVLTISYEGHGKSDGTLGLVKDFHVLADDVKDYFHETCAKKFPDKKYFLMGESMGGAVAYLVVRQSPGFFSGVSFVSPMCKIADNLLPPQWVIDLFKLIAGPAGTATPIGLLPIAPARGDLRYFTYKSAYKRALFTLSRAAYGRRPRLATVRELLDTTTEISNSASEFTVPFLIQHGKDDKVTDPNLSQLFYDSAQSKDKTILIYDDMWHSLTGGESPENCTKVLNDATNWILSRIED